MINVLLFQGRGWAKDDRLGLMIVLLILVFFVLKEIIKWYINYSDKQSHKKERQLLIRTLENYFSTYKWYFHAFDTYEQFESIGFVKEYKLGKIYVLKSKKQERLVVRYLDQKNNVINKKIRLDPETEANIRQYIILHKNLR